MPRPTGNKKSDKDFRSDKRSKSSADKPKRDSHEAESKRGTRGTGRNAPVRKSEPKPSDKPRRAPKSWEKKEDREDKTRGGFKRPGSTGKYLGRRRPEPVAKSNDGLMRLNRFLSNAGIASRRDADKLIELGLVKVNGKVVTELGMKVDPRVDIVKYDDKNLKPEKLQYVLLNKPKDYLTTSEDPLERKTVMHLIHDACKERVYPIGRLDRLTTGLLLFTNDGEMARRLTSPKNGFPKLYHVETLEKIRGEHIDAIREGLKLEEGFIKAEEISLVNGDPRQVGLRINSSKDKIIKAVFEHFKYTVKKVDRVMFASLTKRDLPRGRYRHLSETEVNFLKMIR
ncbi:MAG: pseudouridine synthase [Flavobacteriales bacterium]|jgi:23S rRNA pseudouridine2605 synthase